MSRFMKIDYVENGKPIMLDWKNQAIVPLKAHFDAADPFDPTVWIAEEEPFEIVLPGGHVTPEEA